MTPTTLKPTVLWVLLAGLWTGGCYQAHSPHVASEECIRDCEFVSGRCGLPVAEEDFRLVDCQTSCEDSENNRNLMFPDCAECFVTEAQCRVDYVVEFCRVQCGF